MANSIVIGQQHRPLLALVASVHGDEFDGILALQELSREFNAGSLLGSLIVIPVANPFAFEAAQRRTPHDDVDLYFAIS